MKLKTITTVIISALMVTSLFTGCGGSTSNESSSNKKLSGKITFATDRTDIANTKLKALANDFMKKHPGTTVEFEGVRDYEQTVGTRVSAGEAPDIYGILSTMTKSTYNKYFLSLNDLGYTKSSVHFYDMGVGDDGKLYGLTDSLAYVGIVYNKVAFKKAGIVATPKTLDEFYTDCEKLKEAGITPVGTAFKDLWTISDWSSLPQSSTIKDGNPDHMLKYTKQDKVIDEPVLSSFKTLRELKKKGYLEKDIVSSGWDQFKKDIAQAKVGMYYTESWFPSQVADNGAKIEDVGMFPFPGAKAILATAGRVWAISKNTKNPTLAKAFFKYLWENGRYIRTCGSTPALKDYKATEGYVKEILSSGLPVVDNIATPKDFTDLQNKTEIDFNKTLQAYVLASSDDDAQKVVDEVNKKWADARKK